MSPRRNFASAVWMPVWGCVSNFSPVFASSSERNALAKCVWFPFESLSATGHGEKSIITGLGSFMRSRSQFASFSVSRDISVRRP